MSKVTICSWVKGMLHLIQHEFETIKEALHFARKTRPSTEADQTVVKVYNEHGELVASTRPKTDTYA